MIKILLKIFIYLSLLQKGISIKIAQENKELQEIYKFRWKIYKQEGYIKQIDYPSEKLNDKYDKLSINFLAVKKNKIIGTCRLVIFSSLGFPTENALNLKNAELIREKTAELSKLCVEKKYRGNLVALGLLKIAYEYSKSRGIQYWIMGIPSSLKNHFGKLRIKLEEIETMEPNDIHILERKTASQYFEKSDIKPYLLKIY